MLFPCGQFGNQELGTNAEIMAFLTEQGLDDKPNIHVMAKGDVIGDNMVPVWKMMKEAAHAPDPKWNFQGRFVIGRNGSIMHVPSNVDIGTVVDEALAVPVLRVRPNAEGSETVDCLACLDCHAILRACERISTRRK